MTDAIAPKQIDGLYDDLRQRVLATQTDQALRLLNKVGDTDARLEMLARLALPMARAHALEHALARAIARARDLGRALSSDSVLARALARDLVGDLDEVVRALDENRLVTGFIVTALKADSSEEAAEIASLLFPDIKHLTPQVLIGDVAPILDAVALLQASIDRLNNRPTTEIDILHLSGGAVSVEMFGVKQAIDAFTGVIAPKRRTIYTRQKALEQDSQRNEAEVEALESSHPDAETLQYEKDIILHTLEQKRIEAERMRAQLAQEKLAILIAIYEQYAPNLSPERRIEEAINMLPAFERFFASGEAVQVRR